MRRKIVHRLNMLAYAGIQASLASLCFALRSGCSGVSRSGAGVAHVAAAPGLLGWGPAAPPVREARLAVEGQMARGVDLHPMPVTSGAAPRPDHAGARCSRRVCVIVVGAPVVDHMVDHNGGACTAVAAQVLVSAAPSLLPLGPAGVPVVQASVAVIGQANVALAVHCHPGPVAIHLDTLPNHAIARIHRRRAVAFAALALLGAAPMLLRRRPSSEEVVQRSIAVKRIRADSLHMAAGILDGA
mmetsp:Transcript_41224/g.73874  ORF Transcript_41224/g.73874 Transcript_41224/m.73874 type:complete len:243 (+) Transcript_41224:105-833(+)